MVGIISWFNKGLDNMATIDSKKLPPVILLSSSTHIYYTRVFQFKNASWVTNKYLVGGTVLWQVVQ